MSKNKLAADVEYWKSRVLEREAEIRDLNGRNAALQQAVEGLGETVERYSDLVKKIYGNYVCCLCSRFMERCKGDATGGAPLDCFRLKKTGLEMAAHTELSARTGGMTLDTYQRKAARTINEKLSAEEKIRHAVHGMAAEAGEVNGLYQKVYQGETFDIQHAVK